MSRSRATASFSQLYAPLSVAKTILRQYRITEPTHVHYLGGAGGFSGAQIWKVAAAGQSFCLRRWPNSHPTRERLEWINLVLVHVFNQDCPFVATPIETKSGARYVEASGFFWELTPWMPGEASFEGDPNDNRLTRAMTCLAKFHLATAQVNLGFQKSENIASRLLLLKNTEQLSAQLEGASLHSPWETVERLRQVVLGKRGDVQCLVTTLEPFANEIFPVQPVIRDVWHDHILFTGDEVTGLVDFGAMQMDNVAFDISRLLGSLVGNQPHRWLAAIEAYAKVRQLSPKENDLIYALDKSSAILGGLNWLKWILLEKRSFESQQHVDKRLRSLTARLTH